MTKKDAESPKKRGKKGLVIGILAVAVSTVIAIGATLYLAGGFKLGAEMLANTAEQGGEGQPSVLPGKEAMYMDLSPPFVINYTHEGELRYAQFSVSAMARSDKTLDAVETHLPRIRNGLILLFGTQDFEVLGTAEGKKKLQQAALGSIRTIIREEARVPDVEAVYFTNFVMQ